MSIIVPPDRQHTVSQVVLRQFAVKGEVSLYDTDQQRFSRKGPKVAFHMPFDQHDAVGSEERWGLIEKQIPKLYRALGAGTALGDPAAEELVREVVALHWARSGAMRVAHEEATARVKARSIERLAADPDFLRWAMRKSTGLHATGAEALAWFNEHIHDRAVTESSEEWWSERNVIHFNESLKMMRKWSVQFGHAPAGSDFIISDAPVITMKLGHGGVGPHQAVALGDANEICMPLSPTVMVGFGPAGMNLTLTAETVDRYNDLQLRARLRWIGCAPGGRSDRLLRSTLPVRTRP